MDPFSGPSEMIPNWRNFASITVPDYSLEKINPTQRIIFLTVTIFLLAVALIGNFATIIFNLRRNIRPAFRSCLISLAISDIITGVFASLTYFPQFVNEKTMLWVLGDALCSWIPFLTTLAILVNSITLVCIALDRYMAVVKVVLKSAWEPRLLYCLVGTACVWVCGAGVASPMLFAYSTMDVTVAETDPNNRTIGIRKYDAKICVNDKAENAPYYAIVFSCVFLPMFIAFLWLNATIAIEIWNRRNPLDQRMNAQEGTSSTNSGSSVNQKPTEASTGTKTTSNMSSSSSSIKSNKPEMITAVPPPIDDNNNQLQAAAEQDQLATKTMRRPCQPSNNCRKTRQLRMFKVIIVIMMTFFVCRLPTWIFLLIKLNRNLSASSSWIVHFSLGLLSLANCTINPFLYTFLTETIRFGADVRARIKRICSCQRKNEDENAILSTSPTPLAGRQGDSTQLSHNLHKPTMWMQFCCPWDSCVRQELPDDTHLIDHCESNKAFRRKSYTLNGKEQLSCISWKVGHYANVYQNCNPVSAAYQSDPNHFVDVDLNKH